MSLKQNDEFNEAKAEAEAELVCEHDWDIMDFSQADGGDGDIGEAYEYCTRCGAKSGK